MHVKMTGSVYLERNALVRFVGVSKLCGFIYIQQYRNNVKTSELLMYKLLNCIVGEFYVPPQCNEHIENAMENAKDAIYARRAFPQMKTVTGVRPRDATYEDFQREFKAKNLHKSDCNDKGLRYPRVCSHPPCHLETVDFRGKLCRLSKLNIHTSYIKITAQTESKYKLLCF